MARHARAARSGPPPAPRNPAVTGVAHIHQAYTSEISSAAVSLAACKRRVGASVAVATCQQRSSANGNGAGKVTRCAIWPHNQAYRYDD